MNIAFFAARFNVNVNAVLSANGIGDIVHEGSMYLHRLHVRLLLNLNSFFSFYDELNLHHWDFFFFILSCFSHPRLNVTLFCSPSLIVGRKIIDTLGKGCKRHN